MTEDFEADREICEAALDGPWERGGPYPSVSVIVVVDPGSGWPDPTPAHCESIAMLHQSQEGTPPPVVIANADFIAASRTRWPIARQFAADAQALLTELRFYVGPPMQAKIDKLLLGSAGTEGNSDAEND
jgi:hypothetical protein